MDKKKRLTVSVIVLAVLCCCLAVTSFALAYQVAKLENNSFQTGGIGIDLNGGKPVITADEYLFEPGMTVEKPFYIQNNGTWAVYYKLYFSEVLVMYWMSPYWTRTIMFCLRASSPN